MSWSDISNVGLVVLCGVAIIGLLLLIERNQ